MNLDWIEVKMGIAVAVGPSGKGIGSVREKRRRKKNVFKSYRKGGDKCLNTPIYKDLFYALSMQFNLPMPILPSFMLNCISRYITSTCHSRKKFEVFWEPL